MSKQYVFGFDSGDGKNKKLLGGKGANLCEMTQIGLNVPPGFVISTEACLAYLDTSEHVLPEGVIEQVRSQMAAIEKASGKRFGDPENPLLVSVRSGSAMSMPGMMDTILNLGLNTDTLKGLITQTGNERFGYDAYRRFIQLFGKVALGVPDEKFDVVFEDIKHNAGVKADIGLNTNNLKEASERFLKVVAEHTGRPFPADVYTQLEIAIKAVFNSWMGKRAVDYRREFKITPEMANGTAVNVVTMVFGNMGNDSATGVGFTRDPGTGENVMFGEYLTNAQGEDVVAGIRTPKAVQMLAKEMPEQYKQLEELRNKLESHYREVQDFEYTIEKGVLYCLQTRNGKMNTTAMVRTSVEMAREGIISRSEALMRIKPAMLEQLLHPRLDSLQKHEPLAQGLPASPGAASGHVVFDADRAEMLGRGGEKVILVREETKPEDIHGFFASQGILTSRGGKTSHAAVVARGMGKPCVAGAEGIKVDVKMRQATIGEKVLHEGDYITIDGGTGFVYKGEIPTVEPTFSDELKILLGWADEAAKLKVFANADTPEAAKKALHYGAMGIGLCRTERMFNAPERLPIVVEMILANTTPEREKALDRLREIQKQDFKDILMTMAPRPVTIRLLDPPIHEFLPTEDVLRDELRHLRHLRETASGVSNLFGSLRLLNVDPAMANTATQPFTDKGLELIDQAIAKKEQMLRKVRELYEVNPMLGHRGVRLGLTYPEIYTMQIGAILEAAAECQKVGIDVRPEIMVPQVCAAKELAYVNKYVRQLKESIENQYNIQLHYKFGTMIEVVRACMEADSLAGEAEFFSFGTNDLTQATFSFSREDAENKFLPWYINSGVLKDNPFEILDEHGVGKLMRFAVQEGRNTKPDLKIGICGEHGGQPEAIAFCHGLGLNYVSCSGPRVPVARLAAAQAAM
ncbi:MAG TPA: pyruvate, phosphate dikinase [Chitinophagales bacterium]|nr:pyruvate, phosphate dikinase [Chitinophagales bacterium]HMZ88706.1 pyruvate, phosphate dikinase [Chitinophagales bacterium]HNK99128.1 pyruvate, phosphate dikinase [Chitinophagales bacterium]HNM08547.1 pyruvate, phosphate dikinase [Chitinophagales bacterium]HNO28931.1 pyruvate, phosphate dikinase [Chitinophagales bacterium]